VSITGVGKASAARIIALIGNIARFPNSSKLIAYAGLDPMVRESGDKQATRRISKRGNTHLRTVLFNDARSAIMYPGPLQDYYVRLRAVGKPYMVALVACMNKLLRIIYACWLSGEMFDPERHLEKGNQPVPKTQPVHTLRHDTPKPLAPVSWREAKRRRTKQEREEETLLQEV